MNQLKPVTKKNRKIPISHPLEIQIRVIKALFLREMISHFGRNNIGFLWMFVEPMIFAVGVTLLWLYAGRTTGAMPVAGFALTGYSALVAWRNCIGKTSVAVEANMGLLYHRNITILDLAITRAIFEFSAVTVSLVILTISFNLLGFISLPIDPLESIIAWFLLGWFCIATGLIALYFSQKSKIFKTSVQVMLYLTIPLTGAFSMVSWLPKDMQSILLLSPMANAVEMLREGYFGPGIYAQYSVSYLVTCNLTLSALALILIGKVKKLISSE